MNNHNPRIPVILLSVLLMMTLMLGYLYTAHARVIVNRQAMEIDNPGQPVAGLPAFASAVSWRGAEPCRVIYRLPESGGERRVVETVRECW